MFIKKNYIKFILMLGKRVLKSLYYCRSKSIQRAENVNDVKAIDVTANVYKSKQQKTEQPEYEECLSCQ